MKPRDLALRIALRLQADPEVATSQVAGPGFINLRLKPAFWTSHLADILTAGTDYGRGRPTGRKVNVEYADAAPV